MSSLARVMFMDALLSKIFRESQSVQLRFQQKCEEFAVKPTLFPYNELRVATQDFHPDMELGDTEFGPMYKGVLPNGSVVAVKRFLHDHLTIDEFLNEVVISTRLKHKNLVTLKGCCLHDRQYLLVYEYMENSDLCCFLLEQRPHSLMVPWPMRLKICLGVAQGLHYLRAVVHPKIVHRDIKPWNVFLDRNFDPKIGGFDLASLFPDDQNHITLNEVTGTPGYMAPEYILTWIVSNKVDVYSFGVLCLEIISGRYSIDLTAASDQIYLLEWAWRLYEEGKLSELVDPTLHLTNVEVREVQQVIKLCLMCVQYEAEMRPSMARIVSILQGDSKGDGQVKRRGVQEMDL